MKPNLNINWKNITLSKYLEFRKYVSNNIDNRFAFIEFFENVKCENIPILQLNLLIEKYSHLLEDFQNENEEFISSYLFDEYHIQKNFNLLSFEQWENMDSILKRDEKDIFSNIHLLLAISCQPSKDYKFENAQILSEKILNTSMYNLIPAICFFLFKEIESSNNILSYLKKMESESLNQIEIYMKQIRNSLKYGVGTKFFTICRTGIFYVLMKLWLYRYKKYSLI